MSKDVEKLMELLKKRNVTGIIPKERPTGSGAIEFATCGSPGQCLGRPCPCRSALN